MATDIKDRVNVIRLNEPDSDRAQSVVIDLLVETIANQQKQIDSLYHRLSQVEFEIDWNDDLD